MTAAVLVACGAILGVLAMVVLFKEDPVPAAIGGVLTVMDWFAGIWAAWTFSVLVRGGWLEGGWLLGAAMVWIVFRVVAVRLIVRAFEKCRGRGGSRERLSEGVIERA